MSEEEPKKLNSEVNSVVRVLSGERLKYTCRVHFIDGKIVEWQTNSKPKLNYLNEPRALWLTDGDYSTDAPIMPWQEGMILLVEENPK